MGWIHLGSLFSIFNFRNIFQMGGQREIDLGAHTIKSHGASVAKNHMHDWLILLLLAVIEITLFLIHPFYRFVGKDMMEDLKYPMKDNTIPFWAVPVFDRRGHVAKLCIVFFPLLLASLVGISLVDDYWHHWQDVFAGGILGLVVAVFCYHQFFPMPYNDQGWGPYAYFKALEERNNSNGAAPTNTAVNGQAVECRNQNVERYMGFSVDQNPNSDLDQLESGRR